ncbi:TonB-dependent receptor [Hymenobacter rubripertinctus]|nr:TonB-dependent receptor [Hymenobacter rubripertinctus]
MALLLAMPLGLRAQTTPVFTGTVRTAAGAPAEYATLSLHRPTDSVVVKTEFSAADGRFQLLAPAAGRYLVSVAQVGCQRLWLGPLEAGAAAPLTLTLLPAAATQLRGVAVDGQRPLFERLPDRTLVHVAESPLSAGSTTLDVLGRAPGLTVDAQDNLSLRGKTGLLVLLDGKRVPLTGAELANMLRSLPAEQVQELELITNPPAKYDAQGGAGIISIHLKKDQRLGTNGTANAAYGRGRYGKFTGGLSLNHRQKNLNLFGSYAYADRQNFQDLDISRTYLQDGQPTRFSEQRNTSRSHLQSHTWRAGADYTLSPRTTVGLVASGLASRLPSQGLNLADFSNTDGQLTNTLTARNNRDLRTPNAAGVLSLRHQFAQDSLGTPELTADLDAARYGLGRRLDLLTTYPLRSQNNTNRLLGDQNGTLWLSSAKADYVRNLRGRLRLEAGAKASRVASDNDVLFEREQDGQRQTDTGLTNRFRYTETIGAGYASLTRTRPGLTLTGGLRGEYTRTDGRQDVGGQQFRRRYFQLFPNLSLSRPLTAHHELTLALSRRLDRPTYNQLNPFRSYLDPTSYRVGNPALWPQTSTRVELTHTFKEKYSTGLNYTRTHRPILSVYRLDAQGLVAATDVNLPNQDYWALTLAAPLEPAKWWKLYADAELFYIRFQGQLEGQPLPAAQPGAILGLTNSFKLPHGWSAELNGRYNSLERYGYQLVRAFAQVGAGVQKSVGPATFRLNAADVFYTLPMRVSARYQPLAESYRTAQDSRIITASFTYRFGNAKVAAARRAKSGAEDEKRRAGGVQ